MSSRRKSGRPRADEPSRRSLLLETAQEVFFEHGYETATMDLIAQRAGSSKATLYRYFPNKKALLGEVLAAVVEMIRSNAPEMASATENPRDDLECFGRALLRALHQPVVERLIRLAIEESERNPEVGLTLFQQVTSPMLEQLTVLLKAHADAKRLALADPQLAAWQFLGLIKEVAFWPRLLGITGELPQRKDEEVVLHAVDVLLAAYEAR